MKTLFWISILTQGTLLLVDEFYFHWKRRLPKWERWGHPVDTFFFLVPMGIVSFCPPHPAWQITYFAVSIVSSLVITKDEWVHRERSSSAEQWLHSLLFMLHPVILISAFFLWSRGVQSIFLWVFGFVFIFWVYQIIFWNFYADRIFKTRLGSD